MPEKIVADPFKPLNLPLHGKVRVVNHSGLGDTSFSVEPRLKTPVSPTESVASDKQVASEGNDKGERPSSLQLAGELVAQANEYYAGLADTATNPLLQRLYQRHGERIADARRAIDARVPSELFAAQQAYVAELAGLQLKHSDSPDMHFLASSIPFPPSELLPQENE